MLRSKPSKLRWRVGVWVVLTGNIATPWLHLASWNLQDFQLSWKSKMEPSVAIVWFWKFHVQKFWFWKILSKKILLLFFIFEMCLSYWVLGVVCVIATLGSILDSQLSWESGKFQLARWSHEVVLFPERTTHPSTHRPYQYLLVSPSGASPPLCLSGPPTNHINVC